MQAIHHLNKVYSSIFMTVLFVSTISTVNAGDNIKLNKPFDTKNSSIYRSNKGQWESKVLFRSFVPHAEVSFFNNGFSYSTWRTKVNNDGASDSQNTSCLVWNAEFLEMNSNCVILPQEKVDCKYNYFVAGNNSTQAIQPDDFKEIIYKNIYDGIDLKYYYTKEGEMKYDYFLNSGKNAEKIKILLKGIKKIILNDKDQLEIETEWGTMIEEKPFVYQEINGEKTEIQSSYVIVNDSTFGFELKGLYDHSLPVVIDPVTLIWSSYAGGISSSGGTLLYDIAVDSIGNFYGSGRCHSGFPTTPGSYATTPGASSNGLIFKLDQTGSSLLFGTYFGNWCLVEAIEINSQSEIVFAGHAGNALPMVTVGAYDTSYDLFGDAFFAKLSNDGSTLLYCSYLGGNDIDKVRDIALDRDDNLYLIGRTASSTFPTTPGAFDVTKNTGGTGIDIFVTKFYSNLTTMAYSTFLGGSGGGIYGEDVGGIVVNGKGEVTLCGETSSVNFPVTTGAYCTTFKGIQDYFVTKLNKSGTGLIYSTFIGGIDIEGAEVDNHNPDIALDKHDQAILVGYTQSADYPTTTGVFQPTFSGLQDAVISKFSSDGSSLLFSTYLGGTDREWGEGIQVNDAQEIWYGGTSQPPFTTLPGDFTTTPDAIDTTLVGDMDHTICKLDSLGSQLVYSTYFGGSVSDEHTRIKLRGNSCDEEIYIGGLTNSYDFTVTSGAYQTSNGTSFTNNFVAVAYKMSVPTELSVNLGTDILNCNAETMILNAGNNGSTFLWSTGATTQTITVTTSGTYSVTVTNPSCSPFIATDEITVTINDCTEISEIEGNEVGFSIFPNPTNGDFTLVFINTSNENNVAEIYDVAGRRVHTQIIPENASKINFSLGDNFSKGLYIVKIGKDNQLLIVQ